MSAKKVTEFTGLNRGTVNNIYNKLRDRPASVCESESPFTKGEVEQDESYFAARRVRGIRWRGANVKIPVFGMLKRDDKEYPPIVKKCSLSALLPIIKLADAVIYSDWLKTYDGLVNYGYKKHYRVKHGENEFTNGHNHINGIENFWGLCKVRLAKFRSVRKHTSIYTLKECEFRYNFRNQNIYLILLKELRENKLN